jgi:pyruvate kinase
MGLAAVPSEVPLICCLGVWFTAMVVQQGDVVYADGDRVPAAAAAAVCFQVMTKICREAEASLDYYAMFKNILKQASLPMSPLESLASSAVRTAHKVKQQLAPPLAARHI